MSFFGMDKIQAQLASAANSAKQVAPDAITAGLNQATSTLQPTITQSQGYADSIQNLLMGNTSASSIPGYDNMVSARTDAINDLGTGMAGTGKFFSGTTAQGAADIGGAMSNDLMQQYLTNLMGAAQPGQQMQSNLAGYQMGAGQSLANVNLQQQQIDAAAQAASDANKSSFFGDLLGTAGTIGGFLMGGPAGAAVGGAAGSTVGGAS